MKTVTLTEAQLHQVIRECVEQKLNEDMEEGLGNWFRGAANKVFGDARQGMQNGYNAAKGAAQTAGSAIGTAAQNGYNAVKGAAQTAGNAIGTAAQNGYNAVKQYGKDVAQAGQNASNIGDIQSAMKTIQGLVAKGLINKGAANMVIGNMNNAIARIQGGQQ